MRKISIFIISGALAFNCGVWGQSNSPTEKNESMISSDQDGKKCMDCHSVLYENSVKHTSTTGKECEDCHKSNGNPHPKEGVVAFTLIEKVPDLCLSCHDDTKDHLANSSVIHKALNDKKSCTYCHSPHSSTETKLLVSKSKELCFSCHNKTMHSTEGDYPKTLSNIEQLSKNSQVFHPPFKKCSTTCHNPHGSNLPNLLTLPYPNDDYAPAVPDSFTLCFECHDPEIIESQNTTTATSFRDGDKNLHYQHVKGEKGRKCTLCHSPHATNNAYIIKDKVQFGNWEFKMNYISNDEGGSCSPGCHKEKTYSR